jgi:hypothetical protein
VRGSAQIHDHAFKACVATQAQYVFDTFGKFPGTVPSVFIMNYVQAHHLDLDFYDRFFNLAPTCAPTPNTCNAGTASRREDRREDETWASTYAQATWTCGPSAGEPGQMSCSLPG